MTSAHTQTTRLAALNVEGVSFAYSGTQALIDVSLRVDAGRLAVLLGPNGAGKTTLFSLLSGLFAPGSGQVDVLGADLVTQSRQALGSLGVVFQTPTLDNDLNVRQNLTYFADLHGLTRLDATRRIAEVLETHALAELATRRVSTLSGGQRRRVELARSLIHQPALLLMDEATVGLDIDSRQDFVKHVRQLVESLGVAVLWATHLEDEVLASDMVHILDQGRILASGELGALFSAHHVEDIGSLTRSLRKQRSAIHE